MDYSKDLFSYKGNLPDLLPERMRLPDSLLTRYSYDVTLEELNLMGYQGPITIPNFSDEQHLFWDKHTFTYLVKEGSCLNSIPTPTDNNTARALLDTRIQQSRMTLDKENLLTEEFKKEYGLYKGKLLDLKFKVNTCTLCCADIPEPPLIPGDNRAQQEEMRHNIASGYIRDYKHQYETLGVIPSIDPRIANWLPLPEPGWTRGSGLLNDPFTGSMIVFGRYCFS